MKVEQYWVMDAKGKVIYKAHERASAVAFQRVFQRGSQVLAVSRLPIDSEQEDQTDGRNDSQQDHTGRMEAACPC